MICEALAGLPTPTGVLGCGAPSPLASAGAAAAAAGVAVSAAWAVVAADGLRQRIGGTLSALACLLLAFAVGLPELRPSSRDAAGGLVAVVLDASESQRRGGLAAFEAQRERMAGIVDDLARGLPDASAWRGLAVEAGRGARVLVRADDMPRFADALRAATPGPIEPETDLEAGLAAALAAVAERGGAGKILLATDGIETRGDARAAARSAAAAGVAVHVLARPAARPADGLLSWDLGPEQGVGLPAVLRATVAGEGTLIWDVDGEVGGSAEVDAASPQGVRLEMVFERRGLVSAGLGMIAGEAADATPTERAFTLVKGPARVLVHGAAPWLGALDPARHEATRAPPRGGPVPAEFDLVIVDSLSPADFDPGYPEALLEAAAGGTGLLLVNGPLRGAPEAPQRLSDWEAGALGPVLPVSSDPRTQIETPPRRDVLIIIDVSGSMSGSRLDAGREAAHAVVRMLRPEDTLAIVPFASAPRAGLSRIAMDEAGKARARAAIDALAAGGGTNLAPAIAAAERLRGNNCMFFVIGDNDPYAGVRVSPVCFTMVVGVEGISPNLSVPYGDRWIMPPGWRRGDDGAIVASFEPEEREVFWRPGPLGPVAVDAGSAFEGAPPVGGMALSFPRPAPATRLHLIEPGGSRAPLFAVRRDPASTMLTTAVFAAEIPATWGADPAGVRAVRAMLDALDGWSDHDRFGFRLSLVDEGLAVRLVDRREASASLSARIIDGDGRTLPLALAPDGPPGVFSGVATPRLGPAPRRAALVVETGEGEVQRIPLTLPPAPEPGRRAAGGAEAASVGLDRALIEEIRAITGGADLASGAPRFRAPVGPPPPRPIWPGVASASVVLLSASFFLGGVRR